MRFAENLEGMDELIVMGPVAEAALPCLRRIVSEANPSFKEIAGLAICTIEGPTDAQVQAAGRQRAGGNPLREDPVLSALLPRQLGQVITNEGRPPSEREIAWNPSLTRLTNAPAWVTLRTLAEGSPDSTLAEVARQELRKLAMPARTNAP